MLGAISFLAVITIVILALYVGNMAVESLTISGSASGLLQASSSVIISNNGSVKATPNVLAAQPAVLTTRTSGTAGSLTMNNSIHGIVTGQRVDLYWVGGQCYGAIVGTVAGAVVPIASVSGGTALPVATTAITVGIATSAPFEVTGNNIKALVCSPGTQDGYYVFNNGTTDVFATYVINGSFYQWYSTNGVANPLATFVPTVVYCSHDNVGGAAVMSAGAITA